MAGEVYGMCEGRGGAVYNNFVLAALLAGDHPKLAGYVDELKGKGKRRLDASTTPATAPYCLL